MKTLVFASLAVICFAMSGCTIYKDAIRTTDDSSAYVTLIRISATVDGSERFVFTPHSVCYEHKFWSRPTNVTFNGEPWTDLDHTPLSWPNLSRHLDLSRAWIVKRQGRDVIALEHTANGFDLYLCDSPNGSAYYEVIIAVPRRVAPSPDTAPEPGTASSRVLD
ncbi:MAG TPA: hypothetical protein VL171_04365 [Verrucomicrobiae bacterium]|nr:hypothetical protein [Verrucomicrobiae bacterium]